MIHHVSLGVTDLGRAMSFYDRALAPLGLVRVWARADAAGYGLPGGEDLVALYVAPSSDARPGFHLALAAPSAEAVEAFHAAALAAGGTDAGPPGLRPHYGPGYYAAFVCDPDNWKLEAVHIGPATAPGAS
jgi:catechol 2,3-dioxygenase-like lactoylglutathione lyase family enzyme